MKRIAATACIMIGVLVSVAYLVPWLLARSGSELVNRLPEFVGNELIVREVDGVSDDLLTAGIGIAGLQARQRPPIVDPIKPTPDELRRLAIYAGYHNTRDIDDFSLRREAALTRSVGRHNGKADDTRIPGWEYLALSLGDRSGPPAVMLVQIPVTFDTESPCMVVAPTDYPGNVYSAVATTGSWALARGCAAVYTDRAAGGGPHDLDRDTVTDWQGIRVPRATADAAAVFAAAIADRERRVYSKRFPHSFAVPAAHSGANPGARAGQYVLQAVEFAFYALNRRFGFAIPGSPHSLRRYTPANTVVIAHGTAQGAAAVLRAAEQDRGGVLDGVLAVAPLLELDAGATVSFAQGPARLSRHVPSLFDTLTLQALLQPCASTAARNAAAPMNTIPRLLGQKHCAALAAKGLLAGGDPATQAEAAQRLINDHGIAEEQNLLAPSYAGFGIPLWLAVSAAYSYGRFDVRDAVCGFVFAAPGGDGGTRQIDPADLQQLWAVTSGTPMASMIKPVFVNQRRRPQRTVLRRGNVQIAAYDVEGLSCLRELAIGQDLASGRPLSGQRLEWHRRVQAGIAESRLSAAVEHASIVLVAGRADASAPINYGARAYYYLKKKRPKTGAGIRYYEVADGQHLEALQMLPGMSALTASVRPYAIEAFDRLIEHLRHGTALPGSQVVYRRAGRAGERQGRERPSGIRPDPQAAAILWKDGELLIPK